MRIDDGGAEIVVRPAGDHAVKDNAAIGIKIDEVAVRRAPRNTAEQGDTLVGSGAGRPVNLLIDDAVNAVIAEELARHAVAQGIGERQPVGAEFLVVEMAEMVPGAEPQRAGKAGMLIVAVLGFADQKRRIVQAKIEPVRIFHLRVDGAEAHAGRIAVEKTEEKYPVRVRLIFEADAGRRKRIGGPAARQVLRGDRRPIAVDEEREVAAVEKLGIGRELADADVELVVEEFLLEPYLRKPAGRQRLDVADRDHAADITTPEVAGAADPELVGVEAQALQARDLFEVEGDVGF